MKKSTAIALFLGLLVLGVGVYFISMDDGKLNDPRSLVPRSASLYAEISSINDIGFVAEDLATLTGAEAEMVRRGLLGTLIQSPGVGPMVNSPEEYGVDQNRPISIVIRTGGGAMFAPPTVILIPIDNLGALASKLNVAERDLKEAPQAIGGAFALYRQGYLLSGNTEVAVRDMDIIEEKGISYNTLSDEPLLSIYVSGELIRDASKMLQGMAGAGLKEPARTVVGISSQLTEGLDRMVLELNWTAARAEISGGFHFNDTHPLLQLFEGTDGAAPLAKFIPQHDFALGYRVNPEQAQIMARNLLAEISDTNIAAAIESFLSAVAPETLMTIPDISPQSAQFITVHKIVSDEADADSALEQVRHSNAAMQKFWAATMQTAGFEATAESEDLPPVSHGNVKILGMKIMTTLEMGESLREKLAGTGIPETRVETNEVRFAVVETETDEQYLVSGSPLDEVRRQIDIILGGGKDNAATLAVLPFDNLFGYFIFQPTAGHDTSSISENVIAGAARRNKNALELSIHLPRLWIAQWLTGPPPSAGPGAMPPGAMPPAGMPPERMPGHAPPPAQPLQLN